MPSQGTAMFLSRLPRCREHQIQVSRPELLEQVPPDPDPDPDPEPNRCPCPSTKNHLGLKEPNIG